MKSLGERVKNLIENAEPGVTLVEILPLDPPAEGQAATSAESSSNTPSEELRTN